MNIEILPIQQIPIQTNMPDDLKLLEQLTADEEIIVYDVIDGTGMIGTFKNSTFYPDYRNFSTALYLRNMIVSSKDRLTCHIYDSILLHLLKKKSESVHHVFRTKTKYVQAIERTSTNMEQIWNFVEPLRRRGFHLFYQYTPIDETFVFPTVYTDVIHIQLVKPGNLLPICIGDVIGICEGTYRVWEKEQFHELFEETSMSNL